MNDLNRQLSREIQRLKDEHKVEIENINERHNQEIRNIKDQYISKIKEFENTLHSAIDEEQSKYENSWSWRIGNGIITSVVQIRNLFSNPISRNAVL